MNKGVLQQAQILFGFVFGDAEVVGQEGVDDAIDPGLRSPVRVLDYDGSSIISTTLSHQRVVRFQ